MSRPAMRLLSVREDGFGVFRCEWCGFERRSMRHDPECPECSAKERLRLEAQKEAQEAAKSNASPSFQRARRRFWEQRFAEALAKTGPIIAANHADECLGELDKRGWKA